MLLLIAKTESCIFISSITHRQHHQSASDVFLHRQDSPFTVLHELITVKWLGLSPAVITDAEAKSHFEQRDNINAGVRSCCEYQLVKVKKCNF